MNAALVSPAVVPVRAQHCVVRPQEESYLVYNPRTDELHLLPREAFLVYSLCDGLNSAGDIERELCAIGTWPDDGVSQKVYELLDKFVVRGLLEVQESA